MAAEVSEEFQRHVSALIVVQEIYPELMKNMIENEYPSSDVVTLFRTGIGKKLFKVLSSKQQQIVQSMNTDGYRKVDTDLMYRIIRYFGLVKIPSCGWGSNPRSDDKNQGDDIERLRHNRNAIVHRPRLSLTEDEYNKFFAESMQIAQRIDVGKPSPVFQTKIENVKHLTLSSDMGDVYLANRPEFQGIAPLNNMRNLKIYFEMDIGNELEINADENEYTECVLYVRDPEINNTSEIVRQLEKAIDHINAGRYTIKLLSVEEGSLIIRVTVVNQILKKIKLLYEEVILLFSYIFDLNFVNTNCGQHIDVVLTKSDYTIFEENIHEIEPDTSEPDFKPMELLQMNIAVHNSSFRSEQTLHGEIRGFVNTILNTVDEGTSNRNGSSIDVVMIRNHKETEKPSQPVGPLKISDVYKTEAKLSWKQRENEDELPISEYIIESRETGEFAYTEVEKVKSNLTTFQLTGLKEDEEYFVQVKAVNNIGQSKPLEPSFKTQRSNHVPSKPKNFQVKEKTSTAVTLQWQEPESDGGLPIKLYSLERKENALGQWGNKEKINATSTEFTVKGLLEGVEYFFRINAENDIGASDPVDLPDVIQLTKELCNVYGADRNVTQEQENFYRHSTVIVDETKDSFLHLLDFHLTNQGVTLHRFIEIYEHEIYHLCYNHYPCCQCPPGTRTGTRGSSVLHPPQLDVFLDKTGSKLPGHNPRSKSAPHCCCPVNPYLQLHDLDFTLARLLLVNFTTLVPQGSLERNALDFLVNSRNKSFAHAKEGKIDNNEYKKAMTDIEKQLLVLARVYGKEAETKQRLRDITKQPFNAAICQQLHNTLLQQCRIEETINRLLIERAIPEYLTKDLGDVRVLEGCDARFELWTREIDVKVEWFNGDTKIEESDKFVVESRGQIHRLVVTKADLKDRGIYASEMSGVKRIARLDIEEYFTNNMKSTLKCTEGDNIELSCAVLEDNVTAQWEKDGVGVQQCDKYKIKDEGKYHKLSIIHINPQDAGNYTVKISNRIRSTTVQVQEYFTKPLDTKTCIEGSNVHFECEVLEDNQTALWFKNDTEISTSHRYKEESHGKLHRLVVYQTKLDDQGEYSVQIKNCVRRSELIVQEYFTKNMKRNVKCIEGDNVDLSCEVVDADAVAEWSKDGVILQQCVKYKMQTHGKIHTLSIVGAELQDAGDYSVKINNRVQSTSLKVKEYFTKPLGSRTCIEGESVQFECEVLQDNQTALWFKECIEVSASDKYKVQRHERLHRLVVNNTQLDDQGKYFVKINNCLLASKLIVQEYFTKTLVNTTCIEGDIVQFECEVLHVNQRALWFKNGIEVSTSKKYKVEQSGRIHRLLVHNTKLDDQGEYSVKIKNCVRRSQLIVQVFFTKPLVTVTCIEGESVQFECEVLHGNQKALWFKGYTEVRTSDKYKVERHERLHRLVVNNANLDDQGEYYVEINSCVRRSELIVQDYFTLPLRSRISCIEGESIQFECEVLQDNQTAMWLKDDTEVRASERCKMERDGRLHKLVVNKTKLNDQGGYSVKIKDCVRRSQLIIEEIPASFRYLSKEDKGLYLDIIKSGTETRYYIRIVIVGENGVGKTCLLRRLLGEPIEDVTSTDGIDIVHRCKIRLSDGQWIIDKGSNTRKELIIRMTRALNAKSYDDEKTEHKQNIKISISKPTLTNPNQSGTSKDEQQRHVNRKYIDERMGGMELSVPNTDDKRQGSDEGLSFPTHELRKSISETHELDMTKEKIEPMIDKKLTDKILKKLSKFISDIKKSEIPNEVLVDCGFWDFAGQKHYYPTHNIFLNANAVHLLVADIMKDIKQINTEGGYDKIGEYIDFWFDSIHSCGAVETSPDTTGNLNPPVIVVCTGTDKCKDKLEQRKDEFRKQLLSKLKNENKLKHLRRICCVSNTEPSDTDFVNLRNSIFEFGKNIESFGEKLPLRWIHLEQMLDIVREAGVNILSWPDMTDLASKCSINDEMEVNLFLKYHHKVGTIIYFESLKEYIILKQQWLADAFRCLVSDKYDDDLKLTQEWETLEDTGELKPSLISKLFLKKDKHEFYKHEGHLLKLMEMFGIIVKLTTLIDDEETQSLPAYYMPCMISDKTSISQIYDVFRVKKDNCTPWLCIEFDFMPFDFFNHIFCHYIRKYPVCSEPESKRVAIYHGIGVFYLDKSRQKFVVCFSKNTIALQIWQLKQLQHGKCKEMLEGLKSVINNVKNKYEPRRVSYTIKAKCCNGNIHIVAGRLRYLELLDAKDDGYVCEEHNVIHDTKDFFQTWFEDYSVSDEYVPPQKFKGTEDEKFNQICHICNKESSVYWCDDCQRTMCKHCNNQHGESEQTMHHIVQHVQDKYALDYKVELNVQIITDLKMLNDGLLIVGDWGGKQLVTLQNPRQEQPNFISLPDDPYRIAVVDNHTVAVTLPKTDTLIVVDVRKKEEIQRFHVKVGTGGIIYRDNQLFVCHSKTIKVINMSGMVTRTIPLAVIPRDIYDGKGGHIYCIDEDKLHCVDKNGNHVFTLGDPDMKVPVGISIDDEGQLLVVSEKSKNVLRISPDGKHSQIIITQLPLTYWFSYIVYNSLSRSIVISTDKTVYVYKKV